jgi:hypothetical protein
MRPIGLAVVLALGLLLAPLATEARHNRDWCHENGRRMTGRKVPEPEMKLSWSGFTGSDAG